MMSDPWATPLTALHLMPSGESLVDAAIDTTVQSVAAYYDSTEKRISITREDYVNSAPSRRLQAIAS
jgi:hypothetical protein